MSTQNANTGTTTRVRPAIPYFWWLREVHSQSNVPSLPIVKAAPKPKAA